MQFDLNDPFAVSVVVNHLMIAKREGKCVGLASGTFDLIHYHHVNFLRRCARDCDVLVVGVDSDELVRERKSEGRPIIYDGRRIEMVDALKPVAFSFILASVEAFGIASKFIRPDVIYKNDSFLGIEDTIVGREYAGAIRIIRDVKDHASTTEIITQVARLISTGR